MKKIAVFAVLIAFIYSCGSNDRGELMGVKSKRKWFAEKPLGMTLILEVHLQWVNKMKTH